jgi:taurine dioxygenase
VRRLQTPGLSVVWQRCRGVDREPLSSIVPRTRSPVCQGGSLLGPSLGRTIIMRVVKVGTNGVGARIEGLDLRTPLSPEQLQGLLDCWHEHAVVCIPGQLLSAAEQVAFTRQLGDLVVHPAGHGRHPDPDCPRNQLDDMSLVLHFNGKGRNDRWHTEISGMTTPPRYSVLHQTQSPAKGKGDTLFADMRAAFSSLSPAMQQMLAEMDAVHGFFNYVTPQPERETQQGVWDPTQLLDRATGALLPLEVAHPLVRVHDRAGTKALYISDPRDSFGSRFRGWSREESLPLWDYLMSVATQPENVFTHHWEQGDVLLWDKCVTVSRRVACTTAAAAVPPSFVFLSVFSL